MQGKRIKRILCTWEIGGHLGHISRLAEIIPALRERGFRVSLALTDVTAAGSLVERFSIPVFQAPLWFRSGASTGQRPISASEILFRFGYSDPRGLHALLHAWQTLFSAVRPDVVLGDYSPTALAVARGEGIPTAAFGTGFTLPPPRDPMPAYIPRFAGDVRRLKNSDQRVVDTFNQAAGSAGLASIDDASMLWRSDATFLCTYPEIDHYGDRGASYLGVAPPEGGVPPEDRPHNTPRVLAYLKRDQELPVLDALVRLGWHGVIYAPTLSAQQASPYFRYGLHISHQPLSMRDALQACDLVICHSGHGMVAQALLAAKPLLLLPLQVEQRLLTHRVQQLGAGVLPDNPKDVDTLCAALHHLMDTPACTEQASAFAAANKATPSLASDIAARCWELAA